MYGVYSMTHRLFSLQMKRISQISFFQLPSKFPGAWEILKNYDFSNHPNVLHLLICY